MQGITGLPQICLERMEYKKLPRSCVKCSGVEQRERSRHIDGSQSDSKVSLLAPG